MLLLQQNTLDFDCTSVVCLLLFNWEIRPHTLRTRSWATAWRSTTVHVTQSAGREFDPELSCIKHFHYRAWVGLAHKEVLMKKNVLAILFAVSLIFTSGAFAAGYGDMSGNTGTTRGMSDQWSAGGNATRGLSDQEDMSNATTRGMQAPSDKIIKADELTGKTVQDRTGSDIGTVHSVVLDSTTGATFAVISVDNKLHPVPITALKKMQDKYSLNIDKNKLAQSPSFSEDTMMQQLASRDFDTKVYRFFGIAPPFGSTRR